MTGYLVGGVCFSRGCPVFSIPAESHDPAVVLRYFDIPVLIPLAFEKRVLLVAETSHFVVVVGRIKALAPDPPLKRLDPAYPGCSGVPWSVFARDGSSTTSSWPDPVGCMTAQAMDGRQRSNQRVVA
ncbi:MAG: hypothetical protein ACREPY_09975 [Rhodanobacteraceae bacterium]